MKDQIIRLLGQKDYVPANVPELLRLLRLPPNRQQDCRPCCKSWSRPGGRAHQGQPLCQPREADLIPGRIRMNRAGKGFLQPDDSRPQGNRHSPKAPPARLARRPRAGAARRAAEKFPQRRRRKPERSSAFWNASARRWSARCNAAASFFTSFPTTRASARHLVPEPRDVGRPGACRRQGGGGVARMGIAHTNPEGEIIEVLGAPDEEGVDMLSVLRQYDLPLHFPKAGAGRGARHRFDG
jgi:ribonuclease R